MNSAGSEVFESQIASMQHCDLSVAPLGSKPGAFRSGWPDFIADQPLNGVFFFVTDGEIVWVDFDFVPLERCF